VKSRILVLGASGFIGRRVIHALTIAGRAVPVAVSRSARRAMRDSGVEAHDLDVSHPGALRGLMSGVAGVVNCVAGPPESIVSSAQALLDAACSLSPSPRIVHLSSMAAYGSVNGKVDESTPLRGDLDAYSGAKARTDDWMTRCDFVVTLRPGIVFGPASAWWSDRIARLLVAGRLGDLGSRGEGICNLVYVDDVATAALRALDLEGDALGAFNLANPVPITWNEYLTRYARALHATPVRSISSARLAVETRVLSPPLKLLEMMLRKPALARWNPLPPIRPWLPELCGRSMCMDVTRAERSLGMNWTPLDVALETTASWFRSGGRTVV
jgi:2-alkyl-3-oxoalkanoate reductase